MDLCDGDSTLVQNAFGSYLTYQWLRNGVPIPGATESSYWVKESGEYVINVTPFECPNFTLSSGVGPTFTFLELIIPVITLDNDTLYASSGSMFQWYLNDVEIPGANDNFLEPLENGLYTVSVVDDNNCNAISTPFDYSTTVGLDATSYEHQLHWIVQDGRLRLINQSNESFMISLYNISGSKVFSKHLLQPGNLEIAITSIPKGLFLLQFDHPTVRFTKKILNQ